jgi:hypothetical protein
MKAPTQKTPLVEAATREITFALNAPYPPAEEVDQHVYA